MQFSVRLTSYQKNTLLNICDVDLVGKKISEKNLQVDISKNYYGKEIIEKNEAENLLKNASVINMVGKEIISLSMNLGIGSEKGIKKISGVPFLIVYKI
ncbi:MAG: DUF424 domain-containing protein [Thaumarchaeota archaeon]|nr:DUF424 domain-containing protein [Nitrososphaerota archaeon]